MKLAMIFVATALLSGCATAPSNPACLPIARYDAAAQRQALEEMSALHPASVLRRFVEDYGELRARVAAICDD